MPLTDAEFRKFLDPIGQVLQARELRNVIYYGGIEASLRYGSQEHGRRKHLTAWITNVSVVLLYRSAFVV
jgi:hypothetical protein